MVPVIAGDKAGRPRRPLPALLLQGLVHQMPRLCDSDLIQIAVCWCKHLPVKAVFDSDRADAAPAKPQGWLQLWAGGHVLQDSWKQRDGSGLQGTETKPL